MMFVYIHVPPNNPINACAPSSGPRLSLFSEVPYVLKMKQTRLLIFISAIVYFIFDTYYPNEWLSKFCNIIIKISQYFLI